MIFINLIRFHDRFSALRPSACEKLEVRTVHRDVVEMLQPLNVNFKIVLLLRQTNNCTHFL
jgi:hypothetical protein